MRLHISLDGDLVTELDRRAGTRQRSAYIEAALRQALEDDRRWRMWNRPSVHFPIRGTPGMTTPATWVRTT
nr:hypothetical protein [Candidatus Microthrix sp.]